MAFLQEYTMLDELGKGGFATVYKVRHNDLGYIRAIRVLNETIVNSASETYQKFLRECKLLLRLGNGNHPNIVHIYQPRLLDNKALVEMDYVDGQDILHYLEKNHNFVSAEEVIRMVTQISSALAYCHEDIYRFCLDKELDNLDDDPNDGTKILIDEETRRRLIEKYKVIHNDIHSGNIMRREDGNFVLLDFGLAINGAEVVRSSRHTNGAPEFKAPEKWDDESILTEQSDIYSFGIVMFQYLAGRVPFPYDKSERSNIKAEFKLSEAHLKALPPSIEDLRREQYERKYEGQKYVCDYPKWLEDVILKCLAKNPSERFKNGKELHDCIIAHLQENDRADSSREIVRLTAANQSLSSENNGLHIENGNLSLRLGNAESTLSQKEKELQDAKIKLEKLEKSSDSLFTSVLKTIIIVLFGIWGALMSYLYCTQPSSPADNKASSEVVVPSPDNSKEISDLKSQIKSKDNEIARLKRENEDFKKSVKPDNSAEIASLKSQISQKETEIKQLNSQYIQKSKELEKANTEIASLKRTIASQGSDSSSEELATLRSQVKNLKTKLDKANKEITALKNQLN